MNSTDHTYHDYSQADPPHQPLYLTKMLRQLKTDPNIHDVLDAGCGDGGFAASIAQEGGYTMYGIDLSQGGIARARDKFPDLTFTQSSLFDDLLAPFPALQSFDAIISVEVIEHLYRPRDFMRRAFAALRPGGLLILTTPYWGYLKNIVLSVTNRIDLALSALWDGGHIKHWSYRTLRTLGEQHGFEFVHFEGAGRSIPYLWKGMMMTFRKPHKS